MCTSSTRVNTVKADEAAKIAGAMQTIGAIILALVIVGVVFGGIIAAVVVYGLLLSSLGGRVATWSHKTK